MKSTYDVVVVGGGIAGSSLAAVLARAGVDVLVLERSTVFTDRVRGEAMMPWGVAETKRIGVYDVLVDAGAIHGELWMQYVEGAPGPAPIPVGSVLPGAPAMNIGHPTACEALARAAAAAGATVLRGVDGVALVRDRTKASFSHEGSAHEVSAKLVVGADGRRSVVREQAGIELERQEPPHMISGLLVEPASPLPDYDVIAVEKDIAMLYFLQPHGRVRIYVMPTLEQRDRYTGRDGAAKLLVAVRLECLPMADALADGRPAGPCATYPADDTWTDQPFTDGVVLVGDAAGYNNPINGQGLSLAMRDVRIVGEALLDNDDWSREMFMHYGEEKVERMRRSRFSSNALAHQLLAHPDDLEARIAVAVRRMSDPVLLQGLLTGFTGPESAPAEAFSDDAWAQIVGAGSR